MNATDQATITRLPLYSTEIACGLFGIAEDYIEDYLSLDEKFMQNKSSTFFLRAGGDSMVPEVYPKDILIVDRAVKLKSGDIAAVFYNGSPLCKRYVKQGQQIILRSNNIKYKDIVVTESDELDLFGVVIGLARDLKR